MSELACACVEEQQHHREQVEARTCPTTPPQLGSTRLVCTSTDKQSGRLASSLIVNVTWAPGSTCTFHLNLHHPCCSLTTKTHHPGRRSHSDQTREMTNIPPPPPSLTHPLHSTCPHDSNLHGRCPTETDAQRCPLPAASRPVTSLICCFLLPASSLHSAVCVHVSVVLALPLTVCCVVLTCPCLVPCRPAGRAALRLARVVRFSAILTLQLH